MQTDNIPTSEPVNPVPQTLEEALAPLRAFAQQTFPCGSVSTLWLDIGLSFNLQIEFNHDGSRLQIACE